MRLVETFKNIWKIEELRNRILWTVGLCAVYRLGSFIVLPGIDAGLLAVSGGIQYAENKMDELSNIAMKYIDRHVKTAELKEAFTAYLQFVSQRNL